MKINIFKTQDELIASTALYFTKIAHGAVKEHGAFNVALAGGNSPRKLYELLSTNGFKKELDWSKVKIFFGDERYVPADDSQSNLHMIEVALLNPLKISESQIFKIDTTLSPEDAARKYNETITSHFSEGVHSNEQMQVRFDLTLLGLGDNAHTASLFPFTSVLAESAATVKAVFLKEQNSYRITMTSRMINQSKHIAFLVYGKEKADAVYHVLKDVRDVEKYPAQLIHPTEGELQWFLDEDAASWIMFPR